MHVLSSNLNLPSNSSLSRVEGHQELLGADDADSLFLDVGDAVVLDKVVPDDGLDLHDEEEVVRPQHMLYQRSKLLKHRVRHFFTYISCFFRFLFSSFLFTVSGTGRAT